ELRPVSYDIPPQTGCLCENPVLDAEGLERKRAGVLHVAEAPEHRIPRHVTIPRDPSIRFGKLHVSEPPVRLDERPMQILLLDVHVKRIELNRKVRLIELFEELPHLLTGVDERGLVAVQGLQAQPNAPIGGVSSNLLQLAPDQAELLSPVARLASLTHRRVEGSREHPGPELSGRIHRPSQIAPHRPVPPIRQDGPWDGEPRQTRHPMPDEGLPDGAHIERRRGQGKLDEVKPDTSRLADGSIQGGDRSVRRPEVDMGAEPRPPRAYVRQSRHASNVLSISRSSWAVDRYHTPLGWVSTPRVFSFLTNSWYER